ncbi:MAG: prepilin-type N-terminal cleavage/methylation domain-containing protein [Opitutae bacterium]|nr:prepilin-type N-terminal cleavage/methylation domain-containing protein [Opitutae bacterium]
MKSAPAPKGFTLLELLVAVVITLVLAAVMLAVTTGTLNLWRRTQDNAAVSAQARLALDMIERDLQAALHRQEGTGTAWLAADVINHPAGLSAHGWRTAAFMKPAGAESQRLAPSPGNGRVPAIADARFGLSGVWLRFITTNIDANGSVPVAVSYQTVRRPVSGSSADPANPADVRYSLFRSAVAADTTFAAGYSVTAAAYAGTAAASSTARAASTLTNPYTAGDALATNVVDFGVWLYVRDSTGALRRIYPADNTDLAHATSDAANPGDSGRYPEVADVMVRILTDEGARRLDAMEQANGSITRPGDQAGDAEWWWGVVEADSRVFCRRIEIKGGAG